MKNTSTPGPWRWEDRTLIGSNDCFVDKDDVADARLIASAPALLSTLRGAVAYAEMEGGFHTPPCWYTDAKCLLEKLGGEA